MKLIKWEWQIELSLESNSKPHIRDVLNHTISSYYLPQANNVCREPSLPAHRAQPLQALR